MDQLIITKLHVPPVRGDLIARPRLLARLDTLAHPRLILASAPAGFGKTTVISKWISRSPHPVAWLSLDEADNDPARFWRYLTAALQRAGVAISADIPSLAGSDPGSAAAAVINILAAHGAPLLLCLDDYHLITDPDIQTSMAFLLEHLPAGVTLVLITRSDPPFPLARLRARREMIELRAKELRFSREETAALLAERMHLSLAQDEIAALESRTEGWVVGLQLAALAIRGRDDPGAFIESFAGSHHYIGEYLAEEVLGQQPAEVQGFLLETAFLEQMNAPLCNAVTGRADGEQLLAYLYDNNIFLLSLDATHIWFRYHQLFVDLLRYRLHQTATEEEIRALHRRASHWHRERAQFTQALNYAVAADLDRETVHLLEERWHRILHRGQLKSLRRWLGTLPDKLVRRSAPLSMAACWLHYLSGDHEAIAAPLADVHGAWQEAEREGRIPDREAWLIIPSLRATMDSLVALHRENDPKSALAYGQEALARIPEDERVDEDLLRGSATYRLAQAYQALQQPEKAATLLAQVLSYLKRGKNYIGLANAVYALTDIHLAQDRSEEALVLCEKTLAYFQAASLERLPVVGMVHLALARARAATGRPSEAEAHLDRAVSLAEPTGFTPVLKRAVALREEERNPSGQALVEPLTDREMDVLRLLNEGYTNRQIADALFISIDTVKRHNTHIYGKLAVSNRTQAVLRARELDLL